LIVQHPDGFTPNVIEEPKVRSARRVQLSMLVLAALGLIGSLVVAAVIVLQQLTPAAPGVVETVTPTRLPVSFLPTWTPTVGPTPFILPSNTPTPTPTVTSTPTETPTPVPTNTDVPPPTQTATTRPFIPPPPTRTPGPPTATPTETPIPYAFAIDGPPSLDKGRVCQSQLIIYGIIHDKDYRGLVGVRLRYVPQYGRPPEQPAFSRAATKANDPIKTPDGYYELTLGTSTNNWDIFAVDENDQPISAVLHMHVEADVTGECWWNLNWHQN
jgi:hypothetical protein